MPGLGPVKLISQVKRRQNRDFKRIGRHPLLGNLLHARINESSECLGPLGATFIPSVLCANRVGLVEDPDSDDLTGIVHVAAPFLTN